jgi:hypothetical protein
MKIPALMTPKNAVTASNMVAIPDPAIQPNALRARTVKRIPCKPKISKLNDDFEQQASRLASKTRLGSVDRRARHGTDSWQRLIHHHDALPISAVFGLRYVHHLMRKWAAGGRATAGRFERARRVGVQSTEW